MSDTETITLPSAKTIRAKKNTKPEIAREKLKEKRERLKKEKDEQLIEEAKKRLAVEETMKKQMEEKERTEQELKKQQDPMFQMSQQMKEMMDIFRQSLAVKSNPDPVAVTKEKKARVPRKKKVVIEDEVVEATPPPLPAKPKARAPRKPKQFRHPEESESNIFVGNESPAPPQQVVRESNHPLVALLAQRRRMMEY